VNGNGLFDSEDTTGLVGVTIQLYTDPNGDGDPSDGVVVQTTTTTTGGAYSFTSVPPGTYVVVETDPPGYLSTADVASANDNRIPLNLTGGQNSTGNNFLDTQLGSVAGSVWTDANGNGVKDAGETTGVADVTISLYTDPNGDGDPSDGVLAQTTTTARAALTALPRSGRGPTWWSKPT